MQLVILSLLSIIAYIGGLVLILRISPRLLGAAFDEPRFMGLAILEILGAILMFGAVVITFAVFNGVFPIRVLDFVFLVGIFIVSARVALYSFQPPAHMLRRTHRVSRIITATFGIFLALAAIFYVIQLFTAS